MNIDFNELRRKQAEYRARALSSANERTGLMTALREISEKVTETEVDEAAARRQEKRAREEEERQDRLRASQREYLAAAERRAAAVNLDDFDGRLWMEGIFDHQREAIEFGGGARRWVCGDEPGLGKTRTAIGWCDVVGAKKVLVIAPTEVAGQFAGEVRDLAPHRTVIELHGIAPKIRKLRREAMLDADEAVVVLNYEIFRSDKELLDDVLAWRADTLIADEAHLMKNAKTANFKYVQRIASLDTYCGKCRREVPGLVKAKMRDDGTKAKGFELVPCPHCGWKKGEPSGYSFSDRLSKLIHTRSVKNILLTTGTPLLNAPDELWTLFHLARPDLFPFYREFCKTFTYANAAGHRFFTSRGLENLRTMIAPIYLARTKEEVGIELPDRDMVDVFVPIERQAYPQQRKVIDQITQFSQIVLESGEKLNILEQLAQLTRQRQANVFPGGIEVKQVHPETGELVVAFTTANDIHEAAKMDEIERRALWHRENGDRQVIFSKFSTALVDQERRLKDLGFRVARLDGSTPRALRREIKTNFYRAKEERPRWDIVLVNYETGGAGLNLTSCTVSHILDSEWNPGKEDQALGRTYRIGQMEETIVYRYLVPHSVDSRVEAIKRRKRKLVEEFKNGKIKTLHFDRQAEVLEALTEE